MNKLQKLIDWAKEERENAQHDAAGYKECNHEKMHFYAKGKITAFSQVIQELKLLLSEDATEGGDKEAL